MKFSELFTALKLGNITLQNRIVMAPMTRSRADNEDLAATEMIAAYYEQRASAGLIITEGTFISTKATGYINVPGIYTQKQIAGWQKTTQAVHRHNGKIFAQLWHVGRISHPDFHMGQLPLAPSAINPNVKCFTQNGLAETLSPKAMTIDEIQQTILDFKQAALNAVEAGFDGIELHAANGYLFHQFFASCANNRTDAYGGSIENRARFLFETLDAIAEVIDLNRVGIRLNPLLDDAFGITVDQTTQPTFDYIASELNNYPLAYVHLSGFSKSKENSNLALLANAKHYRNIYKGTMIINSGFSAKTANDAIQDNIAELVSFGIPFIGNPDLVQRFKIDAPLNDSNRATFYTSGPEGYIDYPILKP